MGTQSLLAISKLKCSVPRIMIDIGLGSKVKLLINLLFAINGQVKFHVNEMVGRHF